MTDGWTGRLSEYVDGELDDHERLALEAHLADCTECAGAIVSLRAVVARARSLPERAPTDVRWEDVEARIVAAEHGPEARRVVPMRPRRFTFSLSLPQAAAAAIALVVLSGGAGWWAGARRAPAPAVPLASQTTATPPAQSTSGAMASLAGFDTSHYDAAIADLERALRAHRADLDTSTVRVVEQNLAIIDRAIDQARHALASDPASPFLNGHLARQMMLKLDLLRRATAFPAGQS
jgi:anti-sigma factor RsiW